MIDYVTNRKKVIKICKSCNTQFTTQFPNTFYCSVECKSIGRRKFLMWVAQQRVINKDNNKCYICSSINHLTQHHIIQQIDNGEETITLCQQHHLLIHKFMWLLKNKGYKIIKV